MKVPAKQIPFLLALILAVGIAATASAQVKVVGYAPSWEAQVTSAQLSKVTHINYAFLNPNTGTTPGSVPNGAQLQSLVSSAHGVGVKVLLSVGGWTDGNNTAFENAGSNTANANTFANDMMTIVSYYALDGIDIDWEWPQPGGTDVKYTTLMNAVCAKMHANGKLCTTALVGNYEPGVQSTVFSYIDFATIMAYDNGGETNHSTYNYAVSSLDYWSGRGLAPSKTMLGLPFYGYNASRSVASKYKDIVAADPNAPNTDVSGGVYYNGLATIGQKTTLAMQRADGVMIWNLGQDLPATDTRSLLYKVRQTTSGGGPTPTATPTSTPTATATTPPSGTATATSTATPTATNPPTATPTTSSGCTGVPVWSAGASYTVGQTVTYVYRAGDNNPNPGTVGKTYKYRCELANNNPTWTPGIAGPSVWSMQMACN